MLALDGKMRLTDMADTKELFRLIQSVPSKKAKPFKLWLAEATTTEISKEKDPTTFSNSKIIAGQGGTIAGNVPKEIKVRTGKKIVTPLNAKTGLQGKKDQKQVREKSLNYSISLFIMWEYYPSS